MQAGISLRRRMRRLADERARRQPSTESAVLGIHQGQQAPAKTGRLQRLTMLSQRPFELVGG
jgi:hypothetical protein